MKAKYDLAKLKARKNPYAPKLKKPVTNRLADETRDQVWNALATQRDAEIESGQVAAIDGSAALTRLRAKFK